MIVYVVVEIVDEYDRTRVVAVFQSLDAACEFAAQSPQLIVTSFDGFEVRQ